jgi:hypothetical protein
MRQLRGVHGSSLKQLHPILKRWVRLMEDPEWWRYDKVADAPWWYNERALLSLFAGAIWRSRGVAFEEFVATKRQRTRQRGRRRGHNAGTRGDLMFWWADRRLYFISEAKRVELPLQLAPARLRQQIGDEVHNCISDVRLHPRESKVRRLGILFIAPRFARGVGNHHPLSRDEYGQLSAFGDLLKDLSAEWECTTAWTFPGVFPRPKGVLPSVGTYAYPGAAIVIADAKSWR